MPSNSHSDRGHARYGASSASRWSECPASVPLLEKFPTEASEHAIHGTYAHECIEVLFERMFGDETTKFPASELHDEDIQEAQDKAYEFFGYVLDVLGDVDNWDIYSEHHVEIVNEGDDMYGTADVIAIRKDSKEMHVFDYKHGIGIVVDAEDNLQGLFYAAGACDTLVTVPDLLEGIFIHFYQPRCRRETPESVWVIDINKLAMHRQELITFKNHAVENPDSYKVGDHCIFCNKFKCEAWLNKNMGSLDVFDDIDIKKKPDTLELSPDTLSKIVVQASAIKKFVDECVKLSIKTLENGETIEGLKLVDKKRNRSLGDVESVYKMARKIGATKREMSALPDLLAYTNLVNLIKSKVSDKDKRKELLTELDGKYTLESSGVTVASVDDNRPEAKLVENEFDCVNDESEFDPFA